MSFAARLRKWIGRKKVYFVVGVPLLFFALTPYPLGCGMIYPIRDTLRGHPQGPHGSQPQKFVGFWVRDESVPYDFVGQAFYLMPDGRFAGMPGLTVRRWHFDDDCLFVDAVSRCGNCYQGNVTTEHTVMFAGADEMVVTNRDKDAERGLVGTYRRVEISEALISRMKRLGESMDEGESFKARMVLLAVEQSEALSKFK